MSFYNVARFIQKLEADSKNQAYLELGVTDIDLKKMLVYCASSNNYQLPNDLYNKYCKLIKKRL